MIERAQHGDVTSLRLSWARSRAAGYGVHIFVVRGAMIDTAFPGAHRDVAAIVSSEKVQGVFVTHHHEDHAGNVEMLARMHVPMAMDRATQSLAERPGPIGFYRHVVWSAMTPLRTQFSRFERDGLSLVPTPGHADNHHAVWDASTGTLFSGDLFLGVKVRVAHSYENPRAHVRSLRRVLALSPQRMFCAHRGPVANAASALTAKADWMEQLIGESDRLIDAGLPDSIIARQLVGPPTFTDYFSAGDYSAKNVISAIRNSRRTDNSSQLG